MNLDDVNSIEDMKEFDRGFGDLNVPDYDDTGTFRSRGRKHWDESHCRTCVYMEESLYLWVPGGQRFRCTNLKLSTPEKNGPSILWSKACFELNPGGECVFFDDGRGAGMKQNCAMCGIMITGNNYFRIGRRGESIGFCSESCYYLYEGRMRGENSVLFLVLFGGALVAMFCLGVLFAKFLG